MTIPRKEIVIDSLNHSSGNSKVKPDLFHNSEQATNGARGPGRLPHGKQDGNCGKVRAPALAPDSSHSLASTGRSAGGRVEEWVDYAREVFGLPGTGLAFGLIDSSHNVPQDTYGWSTLYVPISEIKPHRKRKYIDAIQHSYSRLSRTHRFEINMFDESDVMAWFFNLVHRQNSDSRWVKRSDGSSFLAETNGRWSKRRPWGAQVRKRLKGKLETIDNPLLLSLTVHQPRVKAAMPVNTNMDPVVYSILHMGEWVRKFLVKLRKYQERHGIEWRYIGWVLEFQGNGFPHVHILLAGDWIGNIKEIAALWPWSEPQGVDYVNRSKLRKKFGGRGVIDPVRVANYLTAYVAQGAASIVYPGDKIGKGKKRKIWAGEPSIHRGYAYLAFFGGRIFNLAHEKRNKQGGGEDGEK